MPAQRARSGLVSRRTRHLVAFVFAFAAVIAILLWARRNEPWDSITSGPQEVFAAAERMPFRTIEARLSGTSTYRPLRAAGARRSDAEAALIESMRNVARAQKLRGNDYASGLAMLLSGRVDDAVRILESAGGKGESFDRPREAARLSDLSAVLLARAKSRGAGDEMRAADLAEQAWQLDHTPAIAWNRALAREALFLRKPAIAAWRDYLKLDHDSQWPAEAAAHIRQLSVPADSERWLLARARLEAREIPIDAAAVDAIVRDFPQQSRELAELTLLGDSASLRLAGMIGSALVKYSGDYLVQESVAAAERELNRHIKAHAAYVNGRASVSASPLEAAEPLRRAEHGFDSIGSPFRYRAAIYSASAKYSSARLDDARLELDRTIAAMGTAASRYPTVVAQLQWVISLVEYSQGHTNEAMAACRAAAALFARLHEGENEAAMEAMIAASYRSIGQDSEADSHQRRALRLLTAFGQSRRAHAICTDAGIGASKHGFPRTALLFQTEVVAVGRAAGDPVSVCDALVGHAAYAAEAGDRPLASYDLDAASRELSLIKDSAMHDRLRGNLLAAEAVVWRTFAPDRAASAAKAAISEMTRLGHRPRLVQLELEAGRSFAKLSRVDDALASWREGIAECERQRADLPSNEYRQSYFEQCRTLFDESVNVLAHRQRFVDAYRLAEEGRARGLLDAIAPASALAPLPERVPEGLSVVEYSVLPGSIVIWLVDSSGVTGLTRAVRREELGQAIDGLITSTDTIKFNAQAARLYEVLLGPIASRLAKRVVFVPDGDLYRVPFAALRDSSGQFLVQNHVVSVAPSVAILMHQSGARPRLENARALLIDAGSVENDNRLIALEGASREISAIRRLYPEAAMLRGSSCTTANVESALRGAELAHFAGHAVPGGDAIEPTLVLHPGPGDAGRLYAHDIAAMSLRSLRLVILGACGTASGHIGSEGPLSIARAFLAAGAVRAVATLWPIYDDASVPLLVSFHRSLKGGFDAASALQKTQIRAIHASVPAHDWAAFEVLETEADVRQSH